MVILRKRAFTNAVRSVGRGFHHGVKSLHRGVSRGLHVVKAVGDIADELHPVINAVSPAAGQAVKDFADGARAVHASGKKYHDVTKAVSDITDRTAAAISKHIPDKQPGPNSVRSDDANEYRNIVGSGDRKKHPPDARPSAVKRGREESMFSSNGQAYMEPAKKISRVGLMESFGAGANHTAMDTSHKPPGETMLERMERVRSEASAVE